MSSIPPITGVAEIVLSVRDLPLMRDFYRRVLGFELLSESCHEEESRPDPAGQPTIAFLIIAETNTPLGNNGHPQLLALIDHQRHAFARKRFAGHDVTRSTLNHLAFEIPLAHFDEHRQRLESMGLSTTRTEFPNMNASALFFKDPEGNTLELIAHDPEVA